MDVYLRDLRLRLDPSTSIGKGGEADVFDLGDGTALKLYKAPDHPDYAGLDHEQEAARERISTAQDKLRQFPRSLPERVIAPLDLATDTRDKRRSRVVGFTMLHVAGAEVLMRYGDPAARARGLSVGDAVAALGDLHTTVSALHARGVVIGDFNDLNVLVRERRAFLIDADSFQFGAFLCRVFTERFVDPLLCDPALSEPLLARPHGPSSDWYAFAVMVMQTLLCVGPYGGVYKPKGSSPRVPQAARPLKRITVFHPEVVYPKPAIPYRVLPDELLHQLHLIFERDLRAPFPRVLLDDLVWTRCPLCGREHARAACPDCVSTPPAAIKETTTVRGAVTCARVFTTRGAIVFATLQAGALRYVVHEENRYRREDGRVILEGRLDPDLVFAIQGEVTLVGRGSEVAALSPAAPPERFTVDCHRGRPVFAANARYRYYSEGGRLMRKAISGGYGVAARVAEGEVSRVGEVLSGQTLFWVGERFGFGFYRAGTVSVAFVFDADRPGIKDTVKLPFLPGALLGATATFGEDRAWVFFAAQHRGRVVHQCVVVKRDGEIEASAQGTAGDNTFLGALSGKCAAGGFLLAATDLGVVRVEPRVGAGRGGAEPVSGALVETRSFPDTEPFVDASTRLFAARDGLYAVSEREIHTLRIA